MKNKIQISYLNDINGLSKLSGIKSLLIKDFIKKNKIRCYDNKIIYTDTINILNNFRVQYELNNICNIISIIQESSKKYKVKYNRFTTACIGQVNNGKTTLIKKLTGEEVNEEYDITQDVNIIQKDKLYFADCPGHDIFEPIKKIISTLMDVILIVVDLKKGLDSETDKSIQFLYDNDLLDKCMIAFTKEDIKKYESKNILKIIKDKYYFEPPFFINTSPSNEIYKLIYDFALLIAYQKKINYDGLVLKNKIINGSLFNLVRIDRGYIDKKTFLLSELLVSRVIKIKDLEGKDQNILYGSSYGYIQTDSKLDANEFIYISKDQKIISDYSLYILSKKYINSFGDNYENNLQRKPKIKETIDEKRSRRKNKKMSAKVESVDNKLPQDKFIVVSDSMTKKAIEDHLKENKLNDEYNVICSSDSEINLFLDDASKIIYFNRSCSINNTNVININNIYSLIQEIKKYGKNILTNKTIINCAIVVRTFLIRGVLVAGCKMLKGRFNMKDKVMITTTHDDENNYILTDSIEDRIIALKIKDNFVKTVKKNDLFGTTLAKANKIVTGMFIYTY